LLRGIFNIPRGIKSLYSLNIDADGVCLNKLEYGGEEFFDDKPYYTTYPFAEFFSERKRVEPYIFSVNLEWATIFGSRGAITTRNNDLITELSQEFGEARLDVNKHPIFSRLKKFRKRKLNGTYLFVCAPGSDTYAHWVFDILPRLILAKENGYFASVDKIIVSHSNNTFQRETLNWLCLPKEKIINIYNNNEICWQLQKVVTITIPSEFNSVSSWVPVKLKSFHR
jgi:hypothetical protein